MTREILCCDVSGKVASLYTIKEPARGRRHRSVVSRVRGSVGHRLPER